MRTFFEIVIGILLNVAKACLGGLISVTGVLALMVLAVLAGVYAWRRGFRRVRFDSRSCPGEPHDSMSMER